MIGLKLQELYESAKKVLHDIREYWPQIDLDGTNNIWIVKPGAKSRGRGIQLTNKLEKVMDKINPAAIKESRYVVQKYIGKNYASTRDFFKLQSFVF